MSTRRTVFITGIAGFIGFHLASFLHNKGDYVIGCDNFNDYYSPKLKKQRAAKLQALGVNVMQCDIQTINDLLPTFQQEGVSHLVHLAAQAGVRYSLTHPQTYADANLNGFLQVLELCRHLPTIKLIFASSSSVYGATTQTPFSENSPTDDPVSLYAATKKCGELLAKSYHHLYNIPMTCLRFFTVYGPWGRPDMAYFSFAQKILQGVPIPLFNGGHMERDFTYIDDIIKGTAAAIDMCNDYTIYNLGNNHPEKLVTLIELLEHHLGKKALIDMQPMQPGDVPLTFADIQKAHTEIGFQPQTPLSEGIARFTEWFIKYQQETQ